MATVSIDVDAANGVVSTLRSVFDTAMDEWSEVAGAASRGLCSTTPLKALSDPLILVSQSAQELETRVELAVLYNTGDDGVMPTSGVLEYTVSGSDTIANVKEQLGIELAEGLLELEPGNATPGRDDVERFEHYTTLMEKYADDAAVTDGLFAELGPEGVVQMPITLRRFADSYARNQQYMYEDTDRFWDDDTHMLDRISDLQQQFMESFGDGLATSTHSSSFQREHPDFGAQLAQEATESPDGSGWGLSQVLRFGDYEPGFLTGVGEGLYDWEKDQTGPVWGTQLNGDVVNWRLGTDDDGQYYDPFVGLFEAMGRSPEASADFFNPDGGGDEAQERAEYLVQERTWQADDFNALGEALDAAATGFHTTDATVERQEQAAWIASATVHHLAERDGEFKIGDGAKDSLGHLLASYIVDVDRLAGGGSGGLGTFPAPANAPWETGLPVGANFGYSQLQDVLSEVLTDGRAVDEIAGATSAWNAYRIGYAAEDWGGEGTDSSGLQAAVNNSATLQGFVLAAMGAGLESEAAAADEQVQRYIDLSSDVVGLIPTGGTFTSFLADQALSVGKDAASDRWTGNESRVADEQHSVREVAYTDLQIAMAVALAEHGHLTPDPDEPSRNPTTDEEGVVHPWFEAGFDADSLTESHVRDQFGAWLRSGDAGETPTALLPDIAALFDRGVERGSR